MSNDFSPSIPKLTVSRKGSGYKKKANLIATILYVLQYCKETDIV